MSYVAVTPRFRASRHVVFLILAQREPNPVLVAKMARLIGPSASLAREAANLRMLQQSLVGGYASTPRVIALEDHLGHPLLIETALVGRPMDRPTIRRQFRGCCELMADWLAEMPRAGHLNAGSQPSGFKQWVEQPLHDFAASFPLSAAEEKLLQDTWNLVAPLREASLPLVFEHGDLCHPNLLLLNDGRPGVLDWELAQPTGLPACDLFFFLNYAAFARHEATDNRRAIRAFREAFFGRAAWAWPYVRRYAERLHLSPHLLTPLFVLCWVRYVVGLLTRLGTTHLAAGTVEVGTAAWLRSNRYYALWQYTVAHAEQLAWLSPNGQDPLLDAPSDLREESIDARPVPHN
jgi:aminoglycoside phosphotransferase